jgi:hypothetical protein
MKQKFILSFVMIAFTFMFASAQSDEQLTVNAGSVEHIKIAGNIHVVLKQADETSSLISMSANADEKLNVQLSDNSLAIASSKPFVSEKLTVLLYVDNLKTLTVESNSTVSTIGFLNTARVDVFVDGQTRVHLRTNGDIAPHALNDGEVKVQYLSENWLAKQGSKTRTRK